MLRSYIRLARTFVPLRGALETRPAADRVGGRLAGKLTRQEGSQMAARLKQFRRGRPLQPRSCPCCGTPCASAIQAAAHCVGRYAPATVPSVAAPPQGPPSPKAQRVYPTWKYH
jgi:hypothetical protein